MRSLRLFVLLLIVGGELYADSLRVIELQDGSVVAGEIIDINGSVYTIESSSLGTIELEGAQIKAIRSPTQGVEHSPLNSSNPAELMSIQNNIIGDKNVMELIMSLQNNPNVRAVLNDPVIMNMITTGNITGLKSNPKIQKLMNDHSVQEIFERVK